MTDVSKAVGECGIITSLVNKFEADNPDIDVNVTTVEWPGYDQLNAQLARAAQAVQEFDEEQLRRCLAVLLPDFAWRENEQAAVLPFGRSQ